MASDSSSSASDLAGLPPAARVARLNGHDERWQKRFDELLAFQRRHGHFHVPPMAAECQTLAHWITNQRAAYRQRRLPPERQQRLEAAGFPWVAPTIRGNQWETRFAELVAFKHGQGHCRVPWNWPDKKLRNWVALQREQHRSGFLAPERQARLDTLGFFPPAKAEDAADWDTRFAELVAFHNQYHHCNVPSQWTKNPKLGHWVTRQIRNYLHNRMTPEHQERLETLQFFRPAGSGVNRPIWKKILP